MAYNTILIKRRLATPGALAGPPTSLSGGELAFNEVNSTLYYGASGNVKLAIGGEGSFVTLDTNQNNISGAKTFTNLTTLSSVTFSSNSVIDANNNRITGLAEPTQNSDATTLNFVNSVSSNLQSAIDSIGSGSTTSIETLSTEVYTTFVEKTESEAVTLNGGLTVTNGASIDNLTITNNLSVLGNITSIDTEVTTTSAFSITNTGTGPAFTVTQTGEEPVAVFYDDTTPALYIDGKSATAGYIGIGTDAPDHKLTVVGDISASGNVYCGGVFEVNAGAGTTTLFVENNKVGINTETPNEALTVVGSISASSNLYGTTFNINSGTVGPVTFDSSGNITEVTSISAVGGNGTLYGFTIDGGGF